MIDFKKQLQELVEHFGSIEAVASRLNVSGGAVWKWLNADPAITPQRSNRMAITRLHRKVASVVTFKATN